MSEVKKFAVHYFHTTPEEAAEYCCLEGVGWDGQQKITITKEQILKVEEAKCG